MDKIIKFYSLNNKGIIPDHGDKEKTGYYSLYSPEYLSLGSFEVKELDFFLGVEFSPGYFGLLKLVYNLNTGLLILLNNTLEERKSRLKVTLLNVMFDPNRRDNPIDAMFGSRQRIIINPKDEVARLYVLKCQ